jgi:L-amino acid N-acyltransferase YncA
VTGFGTDGIAVGSGVSISVRYVVVRLRSLPADQIDTRRRRWVGFAQCVQSPPGYSNVADISVSGAREHRGQGIGGQLLDAREDRAVALGYHKLVLAALVRNEAGARLYAGHGFRLVGTYTEQGLLDGEWVDVVVMEKLLRP